MKAKMNTYRKQIEETLFHWIYFTLWIKQLNIRINISTTISFGHCQNGLLSEVNPGLARSSTI